MMSRSEQEIYSGVTEIAAYLRLSETVCSRMLKNGALPIHKLGKCWTATRDQLQEIVRNGVQETGSNSSVSVEVFDSEGNKLGRALKIIPVSTKDSEQKRP